MRGLELCLVVGCLSFLGCEGLLEPGAAPAPKETKEAPSAQHAPPPPPPPPGADSGPELTAEQEGGVADTDETPASAPEETDAASGEVITGQGPTTPGPPITIPVKITISRETTYVLGPLRDDGYVDYQAALNELYREGVTPKNNAAIPFWQALGPPRIPKELRRRFFRLLGISPLPEKGQYLLWGAVYAEAASLVDQPRSQEALKRLDEIDDRLEERRAILDELKHAVERPWSKDDHPALAGWLEAKEIPLSTLIEGTQRARFYSPLVCDQDAPTLIEVFMPEGPEAAPVAQALAARAMLRTHGGEVEAAWEDLLACHRLARLVGQGPMLVQGMVGHGIDQIACRGDAALAHHGKLSAEQVRTFQKDLSSLAPLPTMADKIDKGERLIYLDMVCAIAREGPEALRGGDDSPKKAAPELPSEMVEIMKATVEWDEALRMVNAWNDRVVEAMRKPDRAARRQALAKLYRELNRLGAKATDRQSLAKSLFSGKSPGTTMGRIMGGMLLGLLVADFRAAAMAEDRAETNLRLTQLAFALAAYRSDRGLYPPSLSQLAPKYMLDVPKDVFLGGDFQYSQRGTGYLLFSVGENGRPDGGRGYNSEPKGDDIAIRAASTTR